MGSDRNQALCVAASSSNTAAGKIEQQGNHEDKVPHRGLVGAANQGREVTIDMGPLDLEIGERPGFLGAGRDELGAVLPLLVGARRGRLGTARNSSAEPPSSIAPAPPPCRRSRTIG
jgi:hypothetical protein